MNINDLDKGLDIAALAVYTNKCRANENVVALRGACIERGENIDEKDHFYDIGKWIVDGMKLMKDEKDSALEYVRQAINQESIYKWRGVGVIECGIGAEAVISRTRLIESIKGSARGTTGFLVRKGDDGGNVYEAIISTGFKSTVSSKSIGLSWKELPSVESCAKVLLMCEYKQCLEKVKVEMTRQCNLFYIKKLKIKVGGVVEGVMLSGHAKAKKIKVNHIDNEGVVSFEVMASGVSEKNRLRKMMEARLLGEGVMG